MSLIDELKTRSSFLCTKEVMRLLGKRRNTLCEWAKAGRIPAVRIGNEYLYDPRQLADWLTRRQTGSK